MELMMIRMEKSMRKKTEGKFQTMFPNTSRAINIEE
jgi:hypothetical protein